MLFSSGVALLPSVRAIQEPAQEWGCRPAAPSLHSPSSTCHRSASAMSRGTPILVFRGDRRGYSKEGITYTSVFLPVGSCFQRVCEVKTTFTITLKDTLFRVYSGLSSELVLYLFLNVSIFGNSLVAQRLRHHAFTASGTNPFLVEELKSHVTTKLVCCSC